LVVLQKACIYARIAFKYDIDLLRKEAVAMFLYRLFYVLCSFLFYHVN